MIDRCEIFVFIFCSVLVFGIGGCGGVAEEPPAEDSRAEPFVAEDVARGQDPKADSTRDLLTQGPWGIDPGWCPREMTFGNCSGLTFIIRRCSAVIRHWRGAGGTWHSSCAPLPRTCVTIRAEPNSIACLTPR
jgi:hypothetical protein